VSLKIRCFCFTVHAAADTTRKDDKQSPTVTFAVGLGVIPYQKNSVSRHPSLVLEKLLLADNV